jgi:hypothetical protein
MPDLVLDTVSKSVRNRDASFPMGPGTGIASSLCDTQCIENILSYFYNYSFEAYMAINFW